MSDRGRVFVFVVIIVVIALLGYFLFRGGPNRGASPINKPPVLTDYINNSSKVQLTIDGKINADESHRSIHISVSSSERTFEVIQGYEGHVIKSQNYYNNKPAYDAFLRALNQEGFTKVRSITNTDYRGVCPFGWRYLYELDNSGKRLQFLWGSTCSGLGTSGSSVDLINALFKSQIPKYDQLTTDVSLSLD